MASPLPSVPDTVRRPVLNWKREIDGSFPRGKVASRAFTAISWRVTRRLLCTGCTLNPVTWKRLARSPEVCAAIKHSASRSARNKCSRRLFQIFYAGTAASSPGPEYVLLKIREEAYRASVEEIVRPVANAPPSIRNLRPEPARASSGSV